jgi:hypothetical protein
MRGKVDGLPHAENTKIAAAMAVTMRLFVIQATNDNRFELANWIGNHDLVAAYEGAFIGPVALLHHPATQHKRDWPIRRNPLTVVLACEVQVRPSCLPALARRVADSIVLLNVLRLRPPPMAAI